MKTRNKLIGLLLAASLPAYAGPAAFVGLSYDFGDSVGLSVKVVSTNREDRAAAAGVSYFPFSQKFGVDLGVGYVFRNGAATVGWDFLNGKAQAGLGYVKTKADEEPAKTVPAPTPGTEVPLL